jgi:hypothetical protein
MLWIAHKLVLSLKVLKQRCERLSVRVDDPPAVSAHQMDVGAVMAGCEYHPSISQVGLTG